jgi:hypothetical protein
MHRPADPGVEHIARATNPGGTPFRRGIGADVEDASAHDRGSRQERTWRSVTADVGGRRFGSKN